MSPTATDTQQVIAWAKELTTRRAAQFRFNMDFVPDDKLDFKPVPTAKSPKEIYLHTAFSNFGLAGMISHGKVGSADFFQDMEVKQQAFMDGIKSRAEMDAAWDDSVKTLEQAFDSVTDEEMDKVVANDMGMTLTTRDWLESPASHIGVHRGQIDYIQTLWDDQEFHWMVP